MKVCDHLNLLEKDYYGLAIWETPVMKVSDFFFLVHINQKKVTSGWSIKQWLQATKYIQSSTARRYSLGYF